MKLVVFGSSKVSPKSKVYKVALRFGKLAAKEGYTIVNGGYRGIMEAVSKGAKEVGGYVKTILCGEIEEEPHKFFDEALWVEKYMARLAVLMDEGEAFVVFPGSLGTLSEFFSAWCLADNGISKKPIVLVGKKWKRLIEIVSKNFDASEENLTIAETSDEAIKALRTSL